MITDDHRKAARTWRSHWPNTLATEQETDESLAHLLATREEMVRPKWRPIVEYKDEMGFVLAGLWVHNNRLKIDVFEVYKVARHESNGAIDEYGDVISEWSWDDFTHFILLPFPPEPTTTDAGGDNT